jgi:DNA invertase Pin-like site-specific DNA recombinase
MPAPNRVPVERVRQLLAQGVQGKAICERLGVNKSSVSRIAGEMRREQVKR